MRFPGIVASIIAITFLLAAHNCPAQGAKETDEALPKLVSAPEPEYPQEALQLPRGTVRVSVSVDKKGKLKVTGISGPMAPCSNFDDPGIAAVREAVAESVKKAVFEPAMKDGKPVDSNILMTFKVPARKYPASEKGVPRSISGGVLNGKAISLGRPSYPTAAKREGAGGAVNVQVLIDEQGKIIGADAVSGHPLLREAAMTAACKSIYSPTLLQGQPVKVGGVITYNFVP